MVVIALLDQVSGEMFHVQVSEEDAERAYNDITFATRLLVEEKARRGRPPCLSEEGASSEEVGPVGPQESHCGDDGFRWAHEAIMLLTSTFKEEEPSLSSGKVKVKKFWLKIAGVMQAKGVQVTWLQCKSKVNGLKKTYKGVMDHNRRSGNSRKTWIYFDVMNGIFGERPWVAPMVTLESSGGNKEMEHMNSGASGSSSSSASPGREKIRKIVSKEESVEKLLQKVDRSMEERRIMNSEAMLRQDRLLEILEKIANK